MPGFPRGLAVLTAWELSLHRAREHRVRVGCRGAYAPDRRSVGLERVLVSYVASVIGCTGFLGLPASRGEIHEVWPRVFGGGGDGLGEAETTRGNCRVDHARAGRRMRECGGGPR